MSNPSQSYEVSPAIWYHTALPVIMLFLNAYG